MQVFFISLVSFTTWLYIMTSNNLWLDVFNVTENYYIMSIAMIFGSLVAGCTPLGGGAVAFPVAVLLLDIGGKDGRDFTLLIQSVGMSCASAMIILSSKPMDIDLLVIFTVVGLIGMLIAFSITIQSFYIVLIFQLVIINFCLLYIYINVINTCRQFEHVPPSRNNDTKKVFAFLATIPFAFAGGFFVGVCGSGIDLTMYIYGILIWKHVKPSEHYYDHKLTSTSIVAMSILSVVGSVIQVSSDTVQYRVYMCWAAASGIVCWGAPFGAFILVPKMKYVVRTVFMVTCIVQFIGFVILKFQENAIAWFGLASSLVLNVLCIFLHMLYLHRSKRLRFQFRKRMHAVVSIR